MYLLKLVDGEELHLKEKKVIPKEELEAVIETEELIEKAKEQIADLKKKAKEECKEAKKKAEEEGFVEGLSKFNEHVLLLGEKVKELRHSMQQQMLPIVLKTTKKIVGEQLKLHPETVVDIVLQSVKSVAGCKFVKIYVNKSDLVYLEKEKESIKEIFEQLEILQIEERSDITPGGCVIETERGILNAMLESQFRALENAFEAHMKR